jgi:hypothetical protein
VKEICPMFTVYKNKLLQEEEEEEEEESENIENKGDGRS